ncbi:amino acid adenylation domain-containing protein [Nonomuraea sp. NPDC050663]|uniref:amino acid adenylation domain-containing protein n=1 Tax=Nonomuraea sp. NPDC050663 TaxID=3364370 RepID=UPI0037AB0C76
MPGFYVLPASFAQERLWFLSRLDPGSAAFHINAVVELPEDTDRHGLEQALLELVRRHETLRTALAVEDGELAQIVQTELPVRLPEDDLSMLAPGPAAAAFDELAVTDGRRPFELDRAPLWRARLVRMPSGPRMILVVHHAVFDAMSAATFGGELRELLTARMENRQARLPEPGIQYADFAAWQRDFLAGGGVKPHLDFWRARLAGLPRDLGLPTDRPRPATRGHAGAEHALHLPAEVADRLEETARTGGATLFMVLLAGLKAVLSRWAGQGDVVVGTPVAGRDLPEFEPVIGMFVNQLVLRTDVTGDPSFAELVEQVKATVLEALDHADAPFDRVVEAVRPERDPSRTPLYQVSFNLLPMAERAQFPIGTAQTDLSFDVIRQADGIGIWIEYATELFDASTVARLGRGLELLLTSAALDPGQRISALPIVPDDELELLVIGWNATARPYPGRALHTLVAERAAATPHAVAIRAADGAEVTYAALDARSAAMAARLTRAGARPGTCVAVSLPRSPELIVALLGVLRAGAHYLPLDPAHPAERVAYLLADSEAALLVTDRPVEGAATPVLLVGGPDEQLAGGPVAEPEVSPDQLAYLIYTSGSTGRPKGVRVPHRGVVNLVTEVIERLGGASTLLMTSLSFDIAALEIFTPLLSGGTLVLAPDGAGRDPGQIRLAARGAELVQLTPSVAAVAGGEVAGPRDLIVGGEALPPDLAATLGRSLEGGRLWNFYGPTETTIWSTCQLVEPGGPVTIGRPVANTRVYVVDDRLRPQPVGVPGELLIGGDGVVHGYHGRAGLTADRFVPDPFGPPGARLYRTGDLARWREGGVLDFLGRLDDQVKIRGVRIEPGEVAAVLNEHPLVRRAVVTVRDDAPGGRGLVAYVIGATETGAPDLAAALRAHLKERLPDSMMPAAFVQVDGFPSLPSGKLDRAALPPPGQEPRSTEPVPPRTPVEKSIAGIWAELLGRDQVGVTDDFFGLGGHSLLVTKLALRVEEEYGVQVPLRRWFDATTVEEQALVVLEASLAGLDLDELLEEEQ